MLKKRHPIRSKFTFFFLGCSVLMTFGGANAKQEKFDLTLNESCTPDIAKAECEDACTQSRNKKYRLDSASCGSAPDDKKAYCSYF